VSLQGIVDHKSTRHQLTLNTLIEQTEGRGIYLVMVLLCLPFVTPVPLPGLSVLLGLVIEFLALRLAFELPPRLPKFVGDHSLPPDKMQKVLRGSVKFLRFMERIVRPRRTGWMTWQAARFVNALIIAAMAFLMALPLPPIPPLTNMLPSCAIVLLALSMMEEDGVMIWIGYIASACTTIYFLLIGKFVISYLAKGIHALIHLLQNLF
jgi:hypothetical protein